MHAPDFREQEIEVIVPACFAAHRRLWRESGYLAECVILTPGGERIVERDTRPVLERYRQRFREPLHSSILVACPRVETRHSIGQRPGVLAATLQRLRIGLRGWSEMPSRGLGGAQLVPDLGIVRVGFRKPVIQRSGAGKVAFLPELLRARE